MMFCALSKAKGIDIKMNKKIENTNLYIKLIIAILFVLFLFSLLYTNTCKIEELKKEVIAQGKECYVLCKSQSSSFFSNKPKGILLKSDTLSSFLEACTENDFILDSTKTFLCNNALLGNSISDTNINFNIDLLSFPASRIDSVYHCYYYEGIYYALDFVDFDE